ncbi:AgmX/PglI C-terminal domain-containing protein [Polyangium spumosum]|uniref:AgmX/PglI C-terminal domain-containing protein n=2 Tax=Polyangium spumosum TaxID=889282 RepID=A0A6N7PXZ4_9BACT|nr:AgmX/PglI C-terminal domain-containing protein [Polyangium spumosum]
MRTCYEKGLQKNPSLEGRIAVRFVIGTDGKVQSAGEDAQAFPDPAVARCVLDAFQALQFPQPEGGIVTVVYPIRFAANADDCKTTTEEKDGIRTVSLTCEKQSMKVTDMPVKAVDDKLAEAFLTGFEQQSPKMRRTRTKPTIEGKSCWMTSVDGVTWSSMLLVTEAVAGRALVVSCLDESQGGTSAKCNTMVADIIKRTVAPPVVATPEATPKRPLPTTTVTGSGF